jgi:hypothetical protein
MFALSFNNQVVTAGKTRTTNPSDSRAEFLVLLQDVNKESHHHRQMIQDTPVGCRPESEDVAVNLQLALTLMRS